MTQTLLASALNGDRSSLARLLSHLVNGAEAEIRTSLASMKADSVVIKLGRQVQASRLSLAAGLAAHNQIL